MALIVAFVVTVVATPLCGRLARRVGLVDRPGPLKVHARPVPYLGGLALLFGLLGPVSASRPALLGPFVGAAALGLLDDRSGLSARTRLGAEMLIGVAVAAIVAGDSPGRFLLAVVVTVVLVNAVNLLDGLDALAGGVAAVAAAGFVVILTGEPRALAAALVGSAVGFLVWNRPPARIYLGDCGSYLVGTVLAVLVTDAWGADGSTAAASLLLVAVPVADTVVAVVRRARAGAPLLAGDRGHVYDQLVDRGRSPGATVLALIGAQAALAVVGAGVAATGGPTAVVLATVVVAAVGGPVLAIFTRPGRTDADR